ncbi:MAG TPA: NAD(P)-dependent oxidoreductase [Microscillaceae bacterium]|nr:NAD(P)-dependent oxidoreductase [Microscillaceae bacterium]
MNRKAFITGATSGIGEATARLFSQHNIDLILCGRRKEKLASLAQELGQRVAVKTLNFDIGRYDEVKNSIDTLLAAWKEVDILVNNAGGAYGLDLMEDSSIEDWEKMIDFNLKGLLYVSKTLVTHMIAAGKGHIVNVSSIAGKQAYAKGMVYCATKAAVESISESMRLELVPHGIKVTNISPGAVETQFSVNRFHGNVARANSVYKGYDPLVADDIAHTIYYSISLPDHIQIADLTIFPAAQSDAVTIHKN